MAALKILVLLVCAAYCAATVSPNTSISISISTIEVAVPFKDKKNPRDRISCSLPCHVVFNSPGFFVSDLEVFWERREVKRPVYWRIDSHQWAAYSYPQAGCSGREDGDADCNLEIRHCTEDFAAIYRCSVTNLLDRTTVRSEVILTDPENDFERLRCFSPSVTTFSVTMNDTNYPPSLEVNWELTERSRDDYPYCFGSRKWEIRYYTRPSPSSIMDHTPPVFTPEAPPSAWIREGLRQTFYTFAPGEITSESYYLFQLRSEHDETELYTSLIYYFGRQEPAQLITPNKVMFVTEGLDVTLECVATGIPVPTILLWRSGDHVIGRNKVISAASQQDAGIYTCYAINIQVGPPFGKRDRTSTHTIELIVENPVVQDAGSNITCKSYARTTCNQFIFSKVDIFVNYTALTPESDDIFLAEQTLNNMTSSAFDALQASAQLTDDPALRSNCITFAEAVLCHTFYPYCASTSDLPTPQMLCRHTCEILTEGPCRGLLDSNDAFTLELQDLLFSHCDSRLKPAGESPECFAVSFPVPEKDQHLEYASCLEGDGQNYNGDKWQTASGQQCQSWQSQTPHSHPLSDVLFPELQGAGHRCRNPGGLGTRPWCYTSNAGNPMRWEYCDVPKCEVCVPYEGKFCSRFEGYSSRQDVYLNRKVWKEDDPEDWMTELFNSMGGDELFPGCANALKQLICFGALPLCSESDHASPRQVCDEHCSLLADTKYCPSNRVGNLTRIWKTLPPLECSAPASRRQQNCLPPPVHITLPQNFQPTEYYFNSSDYGQSYRGVSAKTRFGIPCQRWDSDSPHSHHFSVDEFPELIGAENYCRNPGQILREPWCFTSNRSIVRQYCNVLNEHELTATVTLTGSTKIPPGHVPEGTVVGVIVALGLLTVFTVVGSIICMLVFCKRAKKSLPQHQASICPSSRTMEQFHGNSAELKLHYNQNYSLHSGVLANYESVIATFPKFDKDNVKYVRQLGQGNFGVVFQGRAKGLIDGEEETTVAVKTLKEELKEAVEDFIHEVKLMFSFDHPNVVKIFAVCMKDPPFYMLTEFMDKGDLSKFLRENASSFQRRYLNPSVHRSRTESNMSNDPAALNSSQLTDVCKQIAAGMEYLSEKNHVHRDLACRNCLVKSEGDSESGLVIKIGDFGMSHNLYSQNYYRVKGHALLPIRWMAPESVIYGKFSTAGDVYSFGIVMWEAFSFAIQPYFGKTNDEVAGAIRKGHLLSNPTDCPQEIYDIMLQCWKEQPKDRLTFTELHSILNECRSSVSSSSSDERLSESEADDHLRSMNSLLSDDAFYDNVCGQSIDSVTV